MKNRLIYSQLFEFCNNANSLASLHSFLIRAGLVHHSVFATKLIASYAEHASLPIAQQLFDETPQRTTFLYNAILRAHLKSNQWHTTLSLFRQMCSSPMPRPDGYTIPIPLKACAELSALKPGKAIHGFIKKSAETDGDMFVGAALIELYARCGEMVDARRVFNEFPQPDVVMWTSLVSWYLQNGDVKGALLFFHRMVVVEGVVPDRVTLVSVVSACAQFGDLRYGNSCHGFIIRRGLDYDLCLVNALLNFYSKVGHVDYAKDLFNNMYVKDVISWSSMIACYVQNQKPADALSIFDEMLEKGVDPNSVTTISALQACGITCDLARGKKIHELAILKGFELRVTVSTALVDMYMKCFCYKDALSLFNRMPTKDVVSWATLISGYTHNGFPDQSLGVFRRMLLANTSPDAVTIVKILTSSSQLGILQQALCLHGYLVTGGFEDKIFVGAALIDLYSKCGSLDNAIEVFEGMREKDIVVWSSMIAGYGIHGLGSEAIRTFHKMIKSSHNPSHVTFVSILFACSHAGLVEEGIKIFDSMLDVYGVTPNSEHYGIMVDLLCRKGEVEKAMELIGQMSIPAGPHVWGALLGGCRIHHNLEVGAIAGQNLLKLDPDHAGYYMLLSNVYAGDGRWDRAAEIRKMIKEKGLRRTPGLSSIEIGNRVDTFMAGDRVHPASGRIYGLLKELEVKMREEGFISKAMFMPHYVEDLV